MGKLEVSFNSPQCGWMSIGFSDGAREFHTTTAHAPHEKALGELLEILTALLDENSSDSKFLLKWNRDPEEFDFEFLRDGAQTVLNIYEYPTEARSENERNLVFSHRGQTREICAAFAETFKQLYEDRETDEFESNWREAFPFNEYRNFAAALSVLRQSNNYTKV
jgi:hypothetical protein